MKEKFFRGVVKHKRLILIVFFIVTIFSALCKPLVSVNYDMNDYLPDDTSSTVSLNVMENEFKGGIPNGRIMVSNVTIPEAIDIKDKLEAIDGFDEVMWLDDVANIKEPLDTIDKDIISDYYIDGNALFTVTVDESKRIEAVNEIRDLIGDDNAFSGTVVDTVVATESTTKEIGRIVMIAVPFTLLVLLVTTTSWFEPIILLLSIGVAIMINSGTNLIFGEISFVTNAAGNILQLAVSLDYSVFLLHRYKEIRKEVLDNKEAMVQALCKSTGSILSSGLTTVIGFLALTVMQFKLGPDLGFALAKGIALSLITVFIFTPGLILYCSKLIDKGEHRNFMPSFNGFAKVVRKIMIPFSILFAIVIVPSYLASINNDYYYGASKIFGEDTKLGRDTKLIEDTFGKSNNFVLMVPRGDFETEEKLSERLKKVEEVSSIISYVDKAGAEVPMEYLDEDTLLMTERYLEFRKDFNKKESVVKTVSVSMVSRLTSGTVLTAVGLLLGYMTTHQLLAQLGRLLGKGTICSLVIVIFVIPGLLYIFDGVVVKKNKIKKAEGLDIQEGLI